MTAMDSPTAPTRIAVLPRTARAVAAPWAPPASSTPIAAPRIARGRGAGRPVSNTTRATPARSLGRAVANQPQGGSKALPPFFCAEELRLPLSRLVDAAADFIEDAAVLRLGLDRLGEELGRLLLVAAVPVAHPPLDLVVDILRILLDGARVPGVR